MAAGVENRVEPRLRDAVEAQRGGKLGVGGRVRPETPGLVSLERRLAARGVNRRLAALG